MLTIKSLILDNLSLKAVVVSQTLPYGNADDLLIGPNPVDENGMLHLMFELQSDQEVYISIYNNIRSIGI